MARDEDVIEMYEKDRDRLIAEIARLRRFERIAKSIHEKHALVDARCMFCELFGNPMPIRPRATGGPEGGV